MAGVFHCSTNFHLVPPPLASPGKALGKRLTFGTQLCGDPHTLVSSLPSSHTHQTRPKEKEQEQPRCVCAFPINLRPPLSLPGGPLCRNLPEEEGRVEERGINHHMGPDLETEPRLTRRLLRVTFFVLHPGRMELSWRLETPAPCRAAGKSPVAKSLPGCAPVSGPEVVPLGQPLTSQRPSTVGSEAPALDPHGSACLAGLYPRG